MKDDREIWLERLSQYFLTNEVKKEKKVTVLLTLLNSEAYTLLRDLLVPKKLPDATLEEISEAMSNNLNPKPSEMVERYKFKERHQGANKSVVECIENLKKLSLHSNFSDFVTKSVSF